MPTKVLQGGEGKSLLSAALSLLLSEMGVNLFWEKVPFEPGMVFKSILSALGMLGQRDYREFRTSLETCTRTHTLP